MNGSWIIICMNCMYYARGFGEITGSISGTRSYSCPLDAVLEVYLSKVNLSQRHGFHEALFGPK